ncbi:MAG: hypothetical protein H7833_06185 [Magnetococcus sp. DMHC-1]
MSFILEALRKAEHRRQREKLSPVGCLTAPQPPVVHLPMLQRVLLPLSAVLAGGLVVGGYLHYRESRTAEPRKEVSTASEAAQVTSEHKVVQEAPKILPARNPASRTEDSTATEAAQVAFDPKLVRNPSKKFPAPNPATRSERERVPAKGAGVRSGCLLDIRMRDRLLTLQLADVACPDAASPLGVAARRFAAHKVFVQEVTVALDKELPDHSNVGDLFDQDNNLLNSSLVREGLAKAVGPRFAADEDFARSRGAGLWLNVPMDSAR